MLWDFSIQTIVLCQCTVEKLIVVQLRPKSESSVAYLVHQVTCLSCINSIDTIHKIKMSKELSRVLKHSATVLRSVPVYWTWDRQTEHVS